MFLQILRKKTDQKVIREIDKLLDNYTESEIANLLNERGIQTGDKKRFTTLAVYRIHKKYKLKNRFTRLREQGMLTRLEIKKILQIGDKKLKKLKDSGTIKTYKYTDSFFLYEPITNKQIVELQFNPGGVV